MKVALQTAPKQPSPREGTNLSIQFLPRIYGRPPFHSSYSLAMVGPTVKPQAKIGKFLNFSGTAYRWTASSAGTPALYIFSACSATSSKTDRDSAMPSWPQSWPWPGTKRVSLSKAANLPSVARQAELEASKVTGYQALKSKSPVKTMFWSGKRAMTSVPEWPG